MGQNNSRHFTHARTHTQTYSMHAARQASYTVSAMQLEVSPQTVLEASYDRVNGTFNSNNHGNHQDGNLCSGAVDTIFVLYVAHGVKL